MDGLTGIADDIAERLNGLEQKREEVIKLSRDIIRTTKKVIHSIHQNDDSSKDRRGLEERMSKLLAIVETEPTLMTAGPTEDAMMEYAEALLLYSIVNGLPAPSYDDLGIRPGSWILGLADCLGELRRMVLTALMSGDLTSAKDLFSEMEEISQVLMTFDVPDAIVPIRRKQDIARGIMERTRTDLANAIMLSKIR